jgi:hypothetical protein
MLPEGAGYEPTEWVEMHSWSKSVEGGDAAILALLDDPVALVDAIREMKSKRPNSHQHDIEPRDGDHDRPGLSGHLRLHSVFHLKMVK